LVVASLIELLLACCLSLQPMMSHCIRELHPKKFRKRDSPV
jgi:hypothetical protein